MLILRILKDIQTLKDVIIEGSSSNHKDRESKDQYFNRTIKGEIIDSMEEKSRNVKRQDLKIEYYTNS